MPAYVPGSKGYIENGDNRRSMRDNPHKYLLYKPSLSQLMVFLSSGFKELPPGGALLLYISADGCFSTTKHPQDCKIAFPSTIHTLITVKSITDGYELGGLATSVKRDGTESGVSIRGKTAATLKEPHCLYPGDLYPYTRRPLFIIIDSDNSFVFAHIPKYFGQPLVILMSPQDVPQNFQGKGLYLKLTFLVPNVKSSVSDLHHHGSLFTLFLHSPLTALCYICNVGDVAIHHWERCQSYIDRFVTEASRLVTRCRMDDIEQGSGFIGKFIE